MNTPKRKLVYVTVLATALAVAPALVLIAEQGEDKMADPNRSGDTQDSSSEKTQSKAHEKATFAAGCFWGVEAAFRSTEGVLSTSVGYTGGHFKNPTYHDVCSGRTGHAEAVEVIFDPNKVSYEQLLDVFWRIHNPTSLNRQGPDVGSQYRSAIFYNDRKQQAAAILSKRKLIKSRRFKRPIVTEIKPASTFYSAEEYHQQYLEKRGRVTCSSTVE